MGLASAILILPVIDAKCAKTDIMTPATEADAPRLAKLGMTVQGEGDAQVADNVTVFKHLRDQDLGCSILHLASDRFAAATLESCWCSLHTCLMVCVQFAYSDILRDLLVDILGRSRTLQRPVQSGRGNRDESLEHAAKVRASARH